MKNKVATILCVGIIALSGCAQSEQVRQIEPERQTETERQTQTEQQAETERQTQTEPQTETERQTQTEQQTQTESHTETAPLTSTEESTADRPDLDGTLYIGEYLDSDVMDPNLEIAEGEDGQYIVQIGIFRLTSIEGVGELTEDGMRFTATDAAGNPISGVITVEDQMATVTFTDSTWTYLPNGSSYQYTKSSDTPNLW